ncbi:rhodanese-like domain-containing protein [Chitinophaga sp. S165]|uniref:MBL fold metallo-hydrolase n=1 Tax=Chitinophaga sp. S165 TaxID=2135462 RepID=UPI000D717878|nr:MBL fold metallo-hydrolase [Chitinophaga sp. S165]PWV45884.1 glyoxylase-like metal-dependent hydrolase (beta-lactamase superfamily II) [Chitinophaga sp. S165]
MKIKQFEDKALSQYSYAVLSENQSAVILIDPARDIRPYLEYATACHAKIIAVIETHPHADFISSHKELHEQTGAIIYCSAQTGAAYPHQAFDDGQTITSGPVSFKAINTPGHSPDSISVLLTYNGKDHAVFTGDTLFIGDCGRPDLRENTGNQKALRMELARQMYHSLREKLMPLEDHLIVYPAHGAGTLCGKDLRDANQSTIGEERKNNWSLQKMNVDQFVAKLLEDPPFIPQYFPYDVEVNRQGAPALQASLSTIHITKPDAGFIPDEIVIDTRPAADFKEGHLSGSFNLMLKGKFETWLGSILPPNEPFYLLAADMATLQQALERAASIGYEPFIKAGLIMRTSSEKQTPFDAEYFKQHLDEFTIIDVRNASEVKHRQIFDHAINIPLPELRLRLKEIPLDKPIAVHCAGGYRSAAASSILEAALPDNMEITDIGEHIKSF